VWEVTDTEDNTLGKFPTLTKAREFARAKWPGCEFDGDLDLGADRIYVYDGDETHHGVIVPPDDYFDRDR
jgi:hypothetical protein